MQSSLVVVAAHSGYGHTRRIADAVVAGAAGVAATRAELVDLGALSEADWARLAAADAIVFGAPTYMGGPSAQFKAFADASSKPWMSRAWMTPRLLTVTFGFCFSLYSAFLNPDYSGN